MKTKEILGLFGARGDVAKLLGVTRTTVIRWGAAKIPEKYRPALLREAHRRNIHLTAAHFLEDVPLTHRTLADVEVDLANLRGRVEALENADTGAQPD